MDHLYKMSCPARTDVGDTGSIGNLCGDCLPDRANLFVSIPVAARHQTGTKQCALLASGRAGANHEKTLRLQVLFAAFGFFEVRVSTVDDDVALIKKWFDLIDGPVHRRS